MAQHLSEKDVVNLIQKSLPEKSYAVAYFSRDREYSYYTFESIEIMIQFLRERQAEYFWINHRNSHIMDFSCDEWFVFANEKLASETIVKVKAELEYEDEDSNP